ncbi:PTS sugar transporter subunit IIA [Candidatus Symbiobacter mobilis]|uniref:Phosphotransferase system IIA component n=1 Tax=Candidatus Symbiobacter mobilis CR TaxID=946483 RepID=U5NCK0_9BURK|nr:Phosphotransferase system IIA component [Candidatus Symbiobacter mobilis]AGX87948.1 Phosphotransferase system IIA component [Candidatus Symbiobacter mobilis CR]
MNAILLLAHAPLASALRTCALHVFPDAGLQVIAVDVHADHGVEDTLCQARNALDGPQCDRVQCDGIPPYDGILVLTDMQGATPGNVARKFVEESPRPARLLCGANLPMLLRAVTYCGEPLDAMLERARAGGIQGVVAYAPDMPSLTSSSTFATHPPISESTPR